MAVPAAGAASDGAGADAVACSICGQLPGPSRCQPLLVGGEVIGSVLLRRWRTLEAAGLLLGVGGLAALGFDASDIDALATGAEPVRLPIPGADQPHAHLGIHRY